MKTRISKIFGVMLTITMIASMFLFTAPVYAAPGDTEWAEEEVPGSIIREGKDVVDFAVASATNIWATDGGSVRRSTNSGQSFSGIDIDDLDTAVAIAVAPDNPNVVAVLDENAGVYTVFITTDDGTNWDTLPDLPAGAVATDVAIAPARSGLLLGREYFVSLADPDAADTTDGNVVMVGEDLEWAAVSEDDLGDIGAGTYDFMSVMVTPNFLGDRSIVAVGATANAGEAAVVVVNTSTEDLIQTAPLDLDGDTIDFDAAAGANSIISADIALPSNYDPTTSGGRRAYVCIASVDSPDDNDVYRISNASAADLDADLGAPRSVAYSGTVSSGKLFAGNYGPEDEDEATVKYSTNPQSGADWEDSEKNPNGINDGGAEPVKTIVRVAADFATTNRVFAGTSGSKSAFSISNDSGVSFTAEAFIDMDTDYQIQGIQLTPDGKTIYMATYDPTDNDIALWKAATPFTNSRWSRLYNVEGDEAMIALNPDWDSSPTIYLIESVADGNIYVSQNGGVTFASRLGPEGIEPTAVAVQDSQIIYLGDADGNVYKSTNAAWTWSDGEDSGANACVEIIVPRFDDVIVGGDGAIAWSTDGGANWDDDDAGLEDTGNLHVAADTLYAGNKTVYLADEDENEVWRYVIGAGKAAQNISDDPSPNDLVEIVTGNGAVYALDNGADGLVQRSLNPLQTTGVDWTQMDAASQPEDAVYMTIASTKTENTVYVANDGKEIWGYKDWLAVSAPELTSLVDKANIPIDPVNGRGEPITIAFKQMGSGRGLVEVIDIEIREKSVGLQGDATWEEEDIPPTAPSIKLDGPDPDRSFRANTEYVWSIRAFDEASGDELTSKWTAARTFTIQSGGIVQQEHEGPVISSPQGGAMNVDPKLVAITWAPVSGATEYTVIVATDSALTKTVGGTPAMVTTTAFQVTGLDNSTTYFYSVQATKPTVGPAGIGSFTTAAKPAPTPTPTPAAPPTTPVIVFPPQPTPAYVWAIIVIGGVLILAVIILIVRTRRVP